MATGKKWGHDELAWDLAEHLENEARMMWLDMPMGPAGSVRPDVYTMEKSFVKPRPISYEIKVSVSDFRSDTTSGKWMNYLDFSSAVVFAVPKGLVTKEDIPKGCGLMTRSDKGWTTVKKPTAQKFEISKQIFLKLIMTGVESEFSATHHQRISARRQMEAQLAQHGEDIQLAVTSLQDARDALYNIHDELRYHRESADRKIDSLLIVAERENHYRKEEAAKLWAEICNLCGMEETDGRHDVRRHFNRLRDQINLDPALKNARDTLRHLQHQINTAMEAIK